MKKILFKKIELWILILIVLVLILTGLAFGSLVHQNLVGRTSAGSWSVKKISDKAYYLASMPEKALLRFLKSTNQQINDPWGETRIFWSNEFKDGFTGSPLNNEAYLLLSRYDFAKKKSIVELIDLQNFGTLHTWEPNFNELMLTSNKGNVINDPRIINPLLLDDGGIVFNGMGSQLSKIDFCSKTEWVNNQFRYHHSINQDADSNIVVPAHIYPYKIDQKYVGIEKENYLSDGIAVLSLKGEVLFLKSISELFIDNGLEYLLFGTSPETGFFKYDPIHLNSITVAKVDTESWKKGDMFLSLRGQSMIIQYRPSTDKVIWMDAGKTSQQHDIEIIDKERISIFNNNSKDFFSGNAVDGNNSIVVYDFKRNEYSKYLNEAMIKYDVRTITQGRGSILSNGDLFIEETDYGRTLYINAEGELQWIHLNKSDNNAYAVHWSRILHKKNEIDRVRKIINNNRCYEK
jgi:hypothetical protein